MLPSIVTAGAVVVAGEAEVGALPLLMKKADLSTTCKMLWNIVRRYDEGVGARTFGLDFINPMDTGFFDADIPTELYKFVGIPEDEFGQINGEIFEELGGDTATRQYKIDIPDMISSSSYESEKVLLDSSKSL